MSALTRLVLALLAGLYFSAAAADGGAIRINPDQFVLEADEGDELEEVFSIVNASPEIASIRLEAVNWVINQQGYREYTTVAEQTDDCRSWWRAGSEDLMIQPGGSIDYGLILNVPEYINDEMECRFAIQVHVASQFSQSPVFHIPIYIQVEGAEPELEFKALEMAQDKHGRAAYIVLRNEGSAHTRVYGMLKGEDAQGQDLDLVLRPTEVLAGQTRRINLLVSKRGGGEVWWSPPVEVEGTLLWGDDDIEVEGLLK